MNIPRASSALLSRLQFARLHVGQKFLPDGFAQSLTELRTDSDIDVIERDESHPLWWFLPAILYDLFGSHEAVERQRALPHSASGLVMIPPPFIAISDELARDLLRASFEVRATHRPFTAPFLGLLYGGYPWFEAYMRLNEELSLIGQKCGVLLVSSASSDVPSALLSFKENRRQTSGKELRKEYPDLAYPGLLRPFHTPAVIENRRHLLAVTVG